MPAADEAALREGEVIIVTKGGNYGWRVKEATHSMSPDFSN